MNTTHGFLERRSRSPVVFQAELIDGRGCNATPDRAATDAELLGQVESAIATLSPKLRAAIVLTALQGLSPREASAIEQCNESTMHSRVALAHQVDLLAGRLLNSKDEVSPTPGPLREIHEVDSLLGRVAADLRRFRRVRPTDFSYREFELPANGHPVGPPISPADTPLGLAILKKSIDRLEATLFINPDRAEAAYGLGFCFSFHIDGIWNADRADELLRRFRARRKDRRRRAAPARGRQLPSSNWTSPRGAAEPRIRPDALHVPKHAGEVSRLELGKTSVENVAAAGETSRYDEEDAVDRSRCRGS